MITLVILMIIINGTEKIIALILTMIMRRGINGSGGDVKAFCKTAAGPSLATIQYTPLSDSIHKGSDDVDDCHDDDDKKHYSF